jgi:hypothetical protein
MLVHERSVHIEGCLEICMWSQDKYGKGIDIYTTENRPTPRLASRPSPTSAACFCSGACCAEQLPLHHRGGAPPYRHLMIATCLDEFVYDLDERVIKVIGGVQYGIERRRNRHPR